MGEKEEQFVNMMLSQSKEKVKMAEPFKPISPKKAPETEAFKPLSEDDIKSVEEYTQYLQKKLQSKK
jgi:hypothetical protein